VVEGYTQDQKIRITQKTLRRVASLLIGSLRTPKERSYKKIRTRMRGADNTVFTGNSNHNHPGYTKWVKRSTDAMFWHVKAQIN
jgi:hypothetical protein